MSDVFWTRGRAWLERLVLPDDERETLEACLRTVGFLDAEVAQIDRALAPLVLASPDMRRLLTLPGVSATTAATLVGVIGDIARFPTPGQLVAYLGLDPRVSQSGNDPAHHGRISKQGASEARHVLVEAAWVATRTAGPLRAFAQRLAARRGWNIAIVAVARKLTVIAWHMLTRGEDYAFARPVLVRARSARSSCAQVLPAPGAVRSAWSRPRPSASSSASSPSRPRWPTSASSRTGCQAGSRCGSRKRGAHLTTQSVNQRAGISPDPALRFGESPAPGRLCARPGPRQAGT